MLLAVAGEDAQRGLEVLREHWARFLPDEADPERALSDSSIDLDADAASCPACAEPFTPGVQRCPGCGLRLG